ncbi:hypothetical protein [Nocardioides sp. TF02-7]|uniref:hypothetical protein n=1 Tax=Nocardioides sp. TF02-7 TaxID=2917724 RepID=UPI001F06CC05|nr:hypothetical protein [Nocardioides sp. TF02-7]UMG93050.1 hypothetical protein MF408_01515 [Nocardioides sp. TF02-7]
MGDAGARSARDRTLILHIGLHKTATTYLQNAWGVHRYDLLREGVLYPLTGLVEGGASTREGAQSGHALFSRPGDKRSLVTDLLTELPDTASTVLLSSEDFSLPRAEPTPEQLLARFAAFGTVKVVLVLRRQDRWIESWYKQLVDQFGNRETRSLDEFLRDEGPRLLDYHARFLPWRELVGPDAFHVISYDDVPDGAAIGRRVLELAGVSAGLVDEVVATPVPRYDSVRAVDTLGLRILNAHRFKSRAERNQVARRVYEAAPAGDLQLMTPEMRAGIEEVCAPVNERIEAEWFTEPVPGLRFGDRSEPPAVAPPSGQEVVDYVDHVLSLCRAARERAEAAAAAEAGQDS